MLRWLKLVINSNLLIALLFFYTFPLKSQDIPKEMVLVPGTKFHFIQINRWREGLQLLPYKEGPIGDAYVEDYWVDLDSFYIDIYEVTNKRYKKFLDVTGYKPKWSMNFLKNWKNGKYPRGKANYPVVYIDYWDAKAYAKWAGKKLPTEAQWQYAAQGIDGRLFPWGDKWDPGKANVGSNCTHTVGSYPEGTSLFGVLDMVGNVAEMTDSFHDDGWHWFSYLRGGSWFQSFESLWYMENGIVTNKQRLKFWWLNPGFNRSPAIGFRCVKKLN